MAYRSPNNRPPPRNRCIVNGCRIVCREAPFHNRYEDDVINSVTVRNVENITQHLMATDFYYCRNINSLLQEAEANCKRVVLTLNNPMFVNSSMPLNWLSNMRSNVQKLSIIGGNLRHIPPYAFMSPFAHNVKSLLLKDITLTTWLPETFIGLSNLQELFITTAELIEIHSSALLTIDDTLKSLYIKAKSIWNPSNVTGSANPVKLTTVDFSTNIFLDTLDEKSFSKLQNCKMLYLSFCQITSLGQGTLDRLENIEILFLDNNYIHQIPDGLFNSLLALPLKPRINLQKNPWTCKCSNTDLRNLHNFGLLIVEPRCYHPEELRGLQFSEFEDYCTNNHSKNESIISDSDTYENKEVYARREILNINASVTCNIEGRVNKNNSFFLISPLNKNRCLGNRIVNYDLVESEANLFSRSSRWFKPIYYSQSQPYSIVEIASLGPSGYGLLWFRSSCPDEVYCVSTLPKVLRVYEINERAKYTFCPYDNGTIVQKECVAYDLSEPEPKFRTFRTYLLYIIIAFICLSCGALFVYGLIRKNPVLLKGSKRVLFVKHKQVDALVLPPKVPLRHDLVNDDFMPSGNNKNIFIVSSHLNNSTWNFARLNSTRSTNSVPSYISAIQPSEHQLEQWRISQHIDKTSTIRSTGSNISTISWIFEDDPVPYVQLESKEPIYEHIN